MFRVLSEALRRSAGYLHVGKTTINVINKPSANIIQGRNLHSLINNNVSSISSRSILLNPKVLDISSNITRNVTKFSLGKGKRKSVKAVIARFYRLNWGGWIRTKAGRNKKLWKKTTNRKVRLRQHVFCNGQQSYLLDKMVGPFWRKPRYYVNDPYNPYHVREEFSHSAQKPRPYFPPENIDK